MMVLLLALLLARPSLAAVRLVLPLSPAGGNGFSAERIDAESRLRSLLSAPVDRRENSYGIILSAAGWRAEEARRRMELGDLLRLWPGLRVEEDQAASTNLPTRGTARGSRLADKRLHALLDAGSTRDSQTRFYDGIVPAGGAALDVAAVGAPAARTLLLTSPAPTRRHVGAAAPPSPPNPTKAPSLSRGAWQVVKGGAEVISDMISVKGLLVAVGAVALVTAAPVAVYGLLALGALVGGWTIGKALLHGSAAYRQADEAGFHEACRELGRGTLTLGLSLYGAQYAPTNLRPHLPRTGNELKALSGSVDDESVVLSSLLQNTGGHKRPESSTIGIRG